MQIIIKHYNQISIKMGESETSPLTPLLKSGDGDFVILSAAKDLFGEEVGIR